MLTNIRKLGTRQKVYIEADLTPDQRTELVNLKNDLKLRQRNGEKDLFLKYVNGIPKILSKN